MVLLSVVVSCTLAAAVAAERPSIPAGQNAALRYWMAFALMENPPAGGDVAKRLAAIADGQGEWSETLAPIVERNAEALLTMRRGTRLLRCDWGYDDELLADAPIANLPRARALARLNLVDGLRLGADGRWEEAVDAWLAGVRFSRDIAADGPWLSALVAAPTLKAHLDALSRAVLQRKIDAALRARVEREIAALPEDGFDWSSAARYETEGSSSLLARIEAADDPVAFAARYVASEDGPAERRAKVARFLGLEAAELADREAVRSVARRARKLNEELRPEIVAAFAAPWEAAAPGLERVDAQAAADPLLANVWGQAMRHHEKRGQVVKARSALLAYLRARRP